ncbi:MAG: hypothetical protein D6722_13100 [Bacteroidetes bacterium]|nr:MAG: hypothetical protein D6722_13100 [Bacteroidota bacterium]
MSHITGKVTYVDISGGFWGIVGDDGAKWHPQNGLPASFRQEGLRVQASGKPAVAAFGISMWGQQMDITDIKKL